MNFFKRHLSRISSEMGSTLIMIIIGMVVIAVLGVGVYTLTMTAAFNQAEAQKAAKAYYISESCVRIAASEYKAATAATKNATLVALQGKTFTMPNNQGSCAVEIYPYWFYATTVYAVGTTSITIYMPGAVPRISADETSTDYTTAVTFPASGYLRVKDQGRSPAWTGTTVLQYTGCTNCAPPYTVGANGTAITFTLSAPLTNATIIGDEFYLGYQYISTAPAPNAGDNLVLNITDVNDLSAKIFPPRRGSIFVGASTISQYTYDERIIDTTVSPHTVTLKNIQAISGAPAPTFPVAIAGSAPGTPIYMGKSLGIRSQSTYGQ